MAVISVDIAGRPYEVRVGAGLLAELVENCRGRLRKPGVAVVTDVNVHAAWGPIVEAALHEAGHQPHWRILPADERLELARRLVESVVAPEPLTEALKEGIRRIEDVATGRVAGLTEEQYRAALS